MASKKSVRVRPKTKLTIMTALVAVMAFALAVPTAFADEQETPLTGVGS